MDMGSSNIEGLPYSNFSRQIEDFNLSVAYPFGEESLRGMLAREYGIERENIIVTVGASEANFLVCMALLEKGKRAIVENPAYQTLAEIPRGLGYEIDTLERRYENGFRLDVCRLTEMIRGGARFAVLCNPHNPTGVAASREDLKEIAEVLEEKDAYLLIDEIFREVVPENRPPLAYSISDRMIVTSSLSKAFGMGGLRLGWAIARSDLIERIEGLKEYLTVACATPSERIARLALARKRKLLERAWDIVRRNRPIVEEWVERNESVECSTVGSVNFFFPRLVGVDESRFARISAVKYKTLIAPGRYFGLPSYFRLGYGMETEKLREGLKNLGQALKEASLA